MLAAAALGPVCQRDHHEPPVVGPLSGNGEDIGHLAPGAQRLQQRLDVTHLAVGIVQRHALRRLDAQQHQRAVLGRGQFLAQAGEQQSCDGGKDQRHHHRHKGGSQRQAQRCRVEPGQTVAQPDHRSARVMGRVHRAQPAAGQNRAQRQGRDRGQQHRNGQRKAEFPEQPPCLPRQEGQRYEHGRQRCGGGDDRKEDLLRAQHGGSARAHAFGPAAHDVFQDHDGIIHHHAGGQNQRQQRQDVDRKPDQPDRGQRSDQRHRHGNGRDQRGADVAQEDIHDRGDDQHRKPQRHFDFVDRAVDEGGRVRGDEDAHIGRQDRLHLCHDLRDRRRDFQRVALRLPDDAKADAGFAIGPQDRRTRFRPQRDLRHIAQAHIRGHFQCLEFRGRGDRGSGAHQNALAGRAEFACGRIEGHIGQRAAKVCQRQAPAGHLHRVDIHAEHLVAVAENLQVGHAGGGQQAVLHGVFDQPGQLLRAAAGRGDGNAQHGVGIGIGLDHARLVGVFGQAVADAGDGIAQIGRGHVQIDVIAEFHRDPA